MKTLIAAVLAGLVLVAAPGDPTHASDTNPTGGDPGPVYIDSSEILYLESYPVQVNLLARGMLSTPCHEPAYEVQDLGTSVDVLLWSLADPDMACIQVLEAFEVVIPLGSFERADLPVFLNGEQVGQIEIGVERGLSALLGAGWSFGECGGYCAADLAIEGDDLLLTGRRWMDEEPLYANRGRLTPVGRARLDVTLATLGGAKLDPVYGCPDCADGGAAYLELVRDGVVERIEMEFSRPPDVLADSYALSAAMIDALETCQSNGFVDVADGCVAYTGR